MHFAALCGFLIAFYWSRETYTYSSRILTLKGHFIFNLNLPVWSASGSGDLAWPPGAICLVSRLGHHPGVGHTLSTPATMAQTLIDQDCLGVVFTPHCPRVQISSLQIWFTAKALDRCSSRPSKYDFAASDTVIMYSSCLCCVTAYFYGNWTSHPSHISIHFWVITHVNHASCFLQPNKKLDC